MSVTQTLEKYQAILNDDVHQLARETGAIIRQRKGGFDAATLLQMLIFAFWQNPDSRLSGLAQAAARREVTVTESAISQRFTPELALLLLRVMKRLAAVCAQGMAVDLPFLKQFSAVIVEDSTTISFPTQIAEVWRGCGGNQGQTASAMKVFVWWDMLTGDLCGPVLCDGRTSDQHSPLKKDALPTGSLYVADLGFFSLETLLTVIKGAQRERKGNTKRFIVIRLQARTNLYTRRGHKITLEGILPQKIGQVREQGVLVGKKGVAMRLIMVKVPEEVAQERQERLRRSAQQHCRPVNEHLLYLAQWSIVLTNVPRRLATYADILIVLRLRWQIERLFRLWKEDGKIDEWRSKKPDRILCECYAKLCAMIMQLPLLAEGCWSDPYRSIVKAAAALRREVNRLMVAFYEGGIEQTIGSVLRCLRAGCRIDRRAGSASTAQLLLEGLDWDLEFCIT